MTKVPGVVPVKSRLHPLLGPERAAALYRCFLLDRLDALAALDGVARVVAYTPRRAASMMAALAPPGLRLLPQRGADLGERMATLLEGLLADGHPAALALGADSPTLPMAWVVEAANALAEGAADLALGPTEDGGYYLIGLRAPCPALFRDVPWSTGDVTRVTLERARAAGLRVRLLPRWFDVDGEEDLRRLAADLRATGSGPERTRAFLSGL
jgi:rSAM/selenodomain-associated transferase 1